MSEPALPTPLVHWGVKQIFDAFGEYRAAFRTITARAKRRFEQRDWRGHQRDAVERLLLVSERVWRVMLRLRTQYGPEIQDRAMWERMKALYAERIRDLPDVEIAETFFNSVTRRIFTTVGVDPRIEFVLAESRLPGCDTAMGRRFVRRGDTAAVVDGILDAYPFEAPYRSRAEDVALAAERIDERLPGLEWIEMLEPVFYRGKAAYLVGRACASGRESPFVIALRHEEDGIYIDAVLLESRDARILFSYTRSYFHVVTDRPRELVSFLRCLLPGRRTSELYIAIGYNKHGKTELYRELLAHLAHTDEKFEHAAGERGMVMIVFTLPSLDLVFKVIRDRFAPPKSTTRDEVKQKYNLVFLQDRAGRLVDAQEFEHLAFDVNRFTPALREELLTEAGETARREGDQLIIKHLYVERRVRPLNLFIREADPEAACEAVVDYGKAIRDLAATNTFPGDLLLKNFGVTQNRRVIFYDYDEMSLVTDCVFRELPRPRDDQEEMAGEPWFYVGPNDIFPEEFIRFLGFTPEQEKAFLARHAELLTPQFWRGIQERLRAGEVVDIRPYHPDRRLRSDEAGRE